MIAEHTLNKSFSVGSHKWLDKLADYLLGLFFFLLPLQTRYIFRAPGDDGITYEYGTLSLFLAEILGWVIIALGAIKIKNQKSKIKNVWIMILPLLGFISILWAPDKAVALQAATRVFEGVLLFVILRYTLYDSRFTMVWAFIAGATLQAGLGLYQFLTQSAVASTLLGMAQHAPSALGTAVVEFADQRWLRAYGGLPHPNVLGGYLAIALAVLLLARNKEQETRNNLLFALCSLLFVTGIFFSFSRAAWIAAATLLVYCLIDLLKKHAPRRMTVYVLLTTFYLLFLALLYRPLVAARIFPSDENRLEVKSRVERVSGAREAWQLIKKHPVIGVGIGNYTQALAREVRPNNPLYTYQPVHNVFLLVWAELGAAGLLFFISILYTILKYFKANVLMILCFFVLMTLDHYFWTLPFGILVFWGILGLAAHNPQSELDKN